MADDFRIDSHKLIFHPTRVSEWLQGKNIYPLCIEISPSGSCNHRCRFCAFDYLEYKPAFLDKDLITRNLKEMAEKGLKSVVVAGEGEPLLNKSTPDIINQGKSYGLDMAMATNGTLFSGEIAENCLASLTWVRFSINAGTPETYLKVHRGHPGDFEKALSNVAAAVELKKAKNLPTTLGVQLLLIPENIQDANILGKRLKKIGVDYFTVKPYSQHPKSLSSIKLDYQSYVDLGHQLKELESDSFRIIFRAHSMNKLKKAKPYRKCWGLPFWAYIDSRANIWACLAFVGDKDFCYGNLNEKSFVELWEGPEKKKLTKKVAGMNLDGCREICRLDEINTYLEELKNPGGHVNFI